MLNIAIVEDDANASSQLKTLCERYYTEKNEKFVIKTFCDGMDFITNFKDDYDIILLDIDMPLLNGMDTAKKIRTIGSRCQIAFITNLTQFVLKGYEVSACGYVLKPVNYDKLKRLLDRIMENVGNKPEKTIVLKAEGDVIIVATDDIYYIEIMGHDLYIHTAEKTFKIKRTLSEFEKALDNSGFARCNHSYLVNLRHVKSVVKNEVIVSVDGKDVNILLSRNKKNKFIEALMAFSR